MNFNCPFGYGQSETEAARITRTGFVQTVEAVEHSLLGVLGNPGALIPDGKFHKVAGPRLRAVTPQRYFDITSRGRILHRVVQEVDKSHS